MINIQTYISKLITLGYSGDSANHIVALHISNGTIDILENYLENIAQD